MVDLNNELYFAKNLKFSELDWNDKNALIDAFKKRVETFYLEPAEKLNEIEDAFYAFAEGVLCVSTIDLLACVTISCNRNDGRFEKWVETNIIEFRNPNPDKPGEKLAHRFYDEFRNGLVHEGRIKNCGQFSYKFKELCTMMKGAMLVNPNSLLETINKSFCAYISKVETEPLEFQKLESYVKRFQKEIDYANQK